MKSTILVAGDICLDVVGIPIPGASTPPDGTDNWRLTGEVRTHYLPGGALQLAAFVRAACHELDADVKAPSPCLPKDLSCDQQPDQPLTMAEFARIAERLTRDEIVHSLLHLAPFKATADSKKADTIRVCETHGFSGPKDTDPSMRILPPDDPEGNAGLIVLDDTGNRFRRTPQQWPTGISAPPSVKPPVVVYKLHRPLPVEKLGCNPLWDAVMAKHAERCIVVVSVDDLRDRDAPISRGLSWERTALDLVWQLLHADAFAPLRDCPHLVVRLGLDGALYWHRGKAEGGPGYHAWLIYDPSGIEGTGASAYPGQIVGFASTFTAALVASLAVELPDCLAPRLNDKGEIVRLSRSIEAGIKSGLAASRRLLEIGYGKCGNPPCFPGPELFSATGKDASDFACQAVPIIPGTAIPDRGYWRLLETIFSGQTVLLHRAVALTATNAKPANKEDEEAKALLDQVPKAVFAKALRAIDRREIENYRALHSLLLDYVHTTNPPRPLSVAVFGPPGAGKSFGVKKVAEALGECSEGRPIKDITFNLSQYRTAEDLAGAFHLVRDLVLRGNIPLVFFDEFDTSLDDKKLGWLRYFLAPMQDGEFLDRGSPHPIGQAIFVFAGGTCGTYAEFARPFTDKSATDEKREAFQNAKGPDFLSRLRATLDIPGLDLQTKFDPFGPVEAFPSEPAIVLRRAGIFAYQLGEKAPHLRDAAGTLRVSAPVLRALLHLPKFVHGNRSFEAMLDMSHFQGAEKFTPALLPASGHTALHADAASVAQLLATDYPFPPSERELIAREIHKQYVEQRKADPKHDPQDPALRDWDELSNDEPGRRLQRSNFGQADDIAAKLRVVGLWFRKVIPGVPLDPNIAKRINASLEELAEAEHNRWVIEKRKDGWVPAPTMDRKSRNDRYKLHNALFTWEELTEELKELDRGPVRNIPRFLAAGGYEIVQP